MQFTFNALLCPQFEGGGGGGLGGGGGGGGEGLGSVQNPFS